MAPLYFAVEARSTRWNESMLGSEALAHGGEGMALQRAVQGGLGGCGIPVGKGGVVVGLDDLHREGEEGEHVLDEGLGDVVSHLLGELHDPQSGAAVEGRVLVQSPSFHQIGHVLDIHLEYLSGTGDEKGSSVALRSSTPLTGQARLLQDLAEGEGGGHSFASLVLQELSQP